LDKASSWRGSGRTREKRLHTVTCYHPSPQDGWRDTDWLKTRWAAGPRQTHNPVLSEIAFAKAAENAVAQAAKTARGLKWARVAELGMELDGEKIAQNRATTRIHFDIEQ